jgi:glyoxylase-like metal-dependent hydrolase (beta-lactamase superfamily II)
MEISSGIHRVGGIRGVNAYLYLPERGPVVVIDTGLAGNADRIVAQIEALGRRRSDVELILLTHPDVDHSGSAARLKRLTGARVAIHEADAPGLAGDKSYERSSGLRGMVFRSLMRFFTVEPVRPDVILKDGDRIAGLEVVHCPGHTAGSVCFCKPGVAAFVGDALITDGKGNPQLPPRGRCWDGRLAAESVKRIAELEFDVLLPGHGEPISRGAGERVRNWLGATRFG